MILACPFCQSRFLIQASLFAAGPRQMRCARCRHSWRAEMPVEEEVKPPPPVFVPEVIPETPLPPSPLFRLNFAALSNIKLPTIPFLSRLTPKQLLWGKIGSAGLFICGLILWIFLGRDSIAARWPAMNSFYDALGLYVDHYYGGVGLSFEEMRSELRYEGGQNRLYVQGKIRNKTQKLQEIPAILATALGADNAPIQSWQIEPPAARVAPGEDVPFTSDIGAPKGTVVNLNLNFVEKKDDASE